MPKKKGKEAQKSLVEQQDTRNEEAPTLPKYKTLVHQTPNSID